MPGQIRSSFVRLAVAGALATGTAARPLTAQTTRPPNSTSPASPTSASYAPDSAVDSIDEPDRPLGPLLSGLSFEAAQAEALAKKRVLVVFYTRGKTSEVLAMKNRCLNSLTLYAYCHWHCVTIATPILPRWVSAELDRFIAANTGKAVEYRFPAVIAIRDREVLAIIATQKLGRMFDNPLLLGVINTSSGVEEIGGSIEEMVAHVPAPLDIVQRVDLALEAIRARDPVWGMLHDQMNPAPPEPPEPPPLVFEERATGPVVLDNDPEWGDANDLLGRLELARDAVRLGDLHTATGRYTWLWERGEAIDPAFRSVRLSVLAQDMAKLSQKRSGARDEFQELQRRQDVRWLWADYPDWHELLVINAISGRLERTDNFFGLQPIDRDEATTLPRADAAVLNTLGLRENFARAGELPEDPAAYVRLLVTRARTLPRNILLPRDADNYTAFMSAYVVLEGARVYAALLVAGRDAEAQEVAALVLGFDDGPRQVRRALVLCAMASEPAQPRPHQGEWLDPGPLRDRVERALAANPGVDAPVRARPPERRDPGSGRLGH